jgi:hypothetical protein
MSSGKASSWRSSWRCRSCHHGSGPSCCCARWRALSTAEVASQLGTSAPSVNSALQRARAAVRSRLPGQSQQSALQALGDQRTRQIAERYAAAFEQADIDGLASPGERAACRRLLRLRSGEERVRSCRHPRAHPERREDRRGDGLPGHRSDAAAALQHSGHRRGAVLPVRAAHRTAVTIVCPGLVRAHPAGSIPPSLR